MGVLIGLLVLAMAGGTFLHHVNQFKADIETVFLNRGALISEFVALRRNQVAVMRDLVVAHHGSAMSPLTLELRRHPDQGYSEMIPKGRKISGAITGSGDLRLTPDVEREIGGALEMDPQIRTALEADDDVVWLYYLSASGFVYTAPEPRQFHFTPQLYQRGYWRQAAPRPGRDPRVILAGPYRDMAGKGAIVTFASPVFQDGRFIGVVALDLKLAALNRLVGLGRTIGQAMMLDEHGAPVTRNGVWPGGTARHPPFNPRASGWQKDDKGGLWISRPIMDGELWLVHHVDRNELYWAAARESAGTWLMIVLMTLVALTSWRLNLALGVVTNLNLTDPLTKLLNRRGLYQSADRLLSLSARKGLTIAVLMVDIDHFKIVNDSHGHAVGDQVLEQLGASLKQAARPSDLVCRWGGEEFVIIILLDNANQAAPIAERIRQAGGRVRVTPNGPMIALSGGLTLMRQGEPIDDAINRTDSLLYRAKEGGRNRLISEI